MRNLLCCLLFLVSWSVPVDTVWAKGLTFHVAQDGNDAWSGRSAVRRNATVGPFQTLERARDEIRRIKKEGKLPKGGVTVEIEPGNYVLNAPFQLTAEDSGTPDSPIVYRASSKGGVHLLGGHLVNGWKPVTDSKVLALLDESARDKVVQANLREQGVTDLGEMKPGHHWSESVAGLELFFQNQPMVLARWPNKGFVQIAKAIGPTPKTIQNIKGCKEGLFVYDGDRPRRWIGQPDIMLEGYWFWDWADQRLRVKTIDPEKHTIQLDAEPEHHYGFRDGQWYYAYNLLPELDSPGEWYLDRTKGILYFWPPSPIEPGQAAISVLPHIMILDNTSWVTISGLSLAYCRDLALKGNGVDHVQILGCTISNIGGYAVHIIGHDNRVSGCDMFHMGNGGILLVGGNRATLAPANNVADNNHIHHFARVNRIQKPGILLYGVGCRATHNLIHDAPHQAIFFWGNDHRIEFNEIHNVCYESNDAGAIYAGRDWTMRGTTIRNNYIHDLHGRENRGCVGVYLDDQFSGTEIFGNLFYKASCAIMVGGGRDCTIANNIFVDCNPAIHLDARGHGWAAHNREQMDASLKQVPYQSPLWTKRYPKLPTILAEDPMAPTGNLLANNIFYRGVWERIEPKAKPLVVQKDNLLDQDPRFVDAEHGNFQLKDDSPAFQLGFKRIPLEKIGLYQHADRATWPVKHAPQSNAVPKKHE